MNQNRRFTSTLNRFQNRAKAFLLPVIAASAALAAPANAAVFVNVGASTATLNAGGPSATITFDGETSGGAVIPGLSSSLTLSLLSQTSTLYTFAYTLANTSSLSDPVGAFGFDVNPNIQSGNAVTGAVFNDDGSGNIAGNSVEFCLVASSFLGSCSSFFNSGGGVNAGTSSSGTFSLQFASNTPNATLSNLVDGYITSAVSTAPGIAKTITTPAVPEPSTWIMMILGLGLVGYGLRRRPSTVSLHAA